MFLYLLIRLLDLEPPHYTKTKGITRLTKGKKNTFESQWEVKVKTSNASDHVVIGFKFWSDWSRELRKIILRKWRLFPSLQASSRKCVSRDARVLGTAKYHDFSIKSSCRSFLLLVTRAKCSHKKKVPCLASVWIDVTSAINPIKAECHKTLRLDRS